MSDTCATCKFFADNYMCRRYPPSAVVIPANADGNWDYRYVFVEVVPEHWCGEYRPAIEPFDRTI